LRVVCVVCFNLPIAQFFILFMFSFCHEDEKGKLYSIKLTKLFAFE